MNNYPENKNLNEGVEEINQVENNLTGKIENPSSPSGSTGSSENIKKSEINQEKIEEKNEIFKISLLLKKMRRNRIKIL